jgi:hypothetical protein
MTSQVKPPSNRTLSVREGLRGGSVWFAYHNMTLDTWFMLAGPREEQMDPPTYWWNGKKREPPAIYREPVQLELFEKKACRRRLIVRG